MREVATHESEARVHHSHKSRGQRSRRVLFNRLQARLLLGGFLSGLNRLFEKLCFSVGRQRGQPLSKTRGECRVISLLLLNNTEGDYTLMLRICNETKRDG